MSFLRKGKRELQKKRDKVAKEHLKYVKLLIQALDKIAILLHHKDITEDNIEEEVAKITDITLGEMEKNYLMKKIEEYKLGLKNED